MRGLIRRTTVGVAAAAALLAATPMSAASASASASAYPTTVTGTFCGARGTFAAVAGIAQTNYIIDTDGRANSAHNLGCFGITPGHHIFWTPRTNPKWREIPGHGIAAYVGRTYLGLACPPRAACLADRLPTVTVRTAANHVYGQSFAVHSTGWLGTWVLNP